MKKTEVITKLFLKGKTDSRELNNAVGWDFRKGVSDWREWFRQEFGMTGTDEKYDPILPVGRDTNNEYKLTAEAYRALLAWHEEKTRPKQGAFDLGGYRG